MYKTIFLVCTLLFVSISLVAQNKILVSKKDMSLSVISESGDILFVSAISVGENIGNKQRVGDCKTPEGEFEVVNIQDSRKWIHDFKDGKGPRKNAYGHFFIRLKVPHFTGIGIHGTCFPQSIGNRSSEGCIRLKNEDMEKLVKLISIGCKCVIFPDSIYGERSLSMNQ